MYGTPIYDRPNSAEQIRKTFSSLITNGIVSTVHNNMAAEVGFIVRPTNGMTVNVNDGMCWINGSFGMKKEKREFTLDLGTEQPRIDAILLRWDNRQTARNIDIFLKKVHRVATRLPQHYKEIIQCTSFGWQIF